MMEQHIDIGAGQVHTGSQEELESQRRLRKRSFFLHLRPAGYNAAAIDFKNTWYLGFFCMFFLVLECVTGAILMVYYAPSPEKAYQSIIRLQTEVPFGSLLRDLHRLGGELMIVATVLHMVRVYVSGSHNGRRSLTWVTGVGLLVITLLLAFSGYLLPWDQLSYWAVTIGTSMAQTIPGIGDQLLLLLRGGPEFGLDGLLRFYLLHIVVLPIALLLLMAVHYYRVARVHGISLPPREAKVAPEKKRRPLFPHVVLFELALTLCTFTLLCLVVTFFYNAPLEHHADSLHTPAQTKAPWFFLWLQGGLKLGDSFIMGICLPLGLLLFLLMLPYIDRGGKRRISKRPFAILGLLVVTVSITWLTILGLPSYGVVSGPVAQELQKLAPDEGESVLFTIDFDDLVQGIYETDVVYKELPASFRDWLHGFTTTVERLNSNEALSRVKGVVIVQQWQLNIKRVVLRVIWEDETDSKQSKSGEKVLFISRHRTQKIDGDVHGAM